MLDDATLARFQHQGQMLAQRVLKRFRHLHKRFARQQIDVFRLYDWDIPEIRAVVDWYAGHLVVGEYVRRQSVPEWLPRMGEAVAQALGVPPQRLHLKARHAGKQEGQRYERLARTGGKIIVHERDLRFYVNPWDFVDTGLFGDHRNTRQMVRELATGRDVLNLYCYTGAFTCYAARGGARGSVSVDRAEETIHWARENLKLNDIAAEPHKLVQDHVPDFLRRARQLGQRFDLAVVDPPSYSTTRTRDEAFDILADHPRLLAAVVDVLRPSALLFFSTNHQGFEPQFGELVLSAIEEITHQTIPEDYVRPRTPIHRCWRMTV